MGFGRRSAREVESYPHSQRVPVVASDQNVVAFDPTGRGSRRRRESRRRSEVEQSRRSDACNLYTCCEATEPNNNDEKRR
ncbi:hypothetical protein M5K25_011030 [Dendrobium thyrsiflorum]|uniref:Uncharacterized protein n=1 Tax=Dendrobium thyrsiflorum TaxID=117978 RepID=A0ABD0V1U4_DENTH